MTTNEHQKPYEPPYRTMKEIKRAPIQEKTDEEIRAEMKESVRRNAKTLQILARM